MIRFETAKDRDAFRALIGELGCASFSDLGRVMLSDEFVVLQDPEARRCFISRCHELDLRPAELLRHLVNSFEEYARGESGGLLPVRVIPKKRLDEE